MHPLLKQDLKLGGAYRNRLFMGASDLCALRGSLRAALQLDVKSSEECERNKFPIWRRMIVRVQGAKTGA